MTDRSSNASSLPLPLAILVLITLCCLVPFCNRAFNIDEPLFVWVAHQIQAHPLDFYGFKINWYGTEMGASAVIKNPPLASYYLALVASAFGWNEIPLHLAFLLPALAASLGTFFLARLFSRNPLPAALLATLTPVFILSGATVMCDTAMLAFYVWAVFFWVRGTREDRLLDLAVAAVLAALCALTKYFGVSLIPLLFLYSLASGRGKLKGTLFLLIPAALLALYQRETFLLYGRGLLSDAASYASTEKGMRLSGLAGNLAVGLSFTGGCFLSLFFLAPELKSKRPLLVAALLVPLSALLVALVGVPRAGSGAAYHLQLALLMAAGLSLLVLACQDLARHRDADSLLLFLWITGTFLFAAVVNWSVNGRSLLPMTPAAALVVMRYLERANGPQWRPRLARLAPPLALAFLFSMTVTWADYRLADTARSAAHTVASTYGGSPRPVWFQGHWGFQYYLQQSGAHPYDRKRTEIHAGDVMVIPGNNTNIFQEIYDRGTPLKVLKFEPASFLSTMNFAAGAGYYSSGFGALPFLFGSGFEELYHVIDFRQPVPPS